MEINENLETNLNEDNDPILPDGWTENDDIFADNWGNAAPAKAEEEEEDFFADTDDSLFEEEAKATETDPTTDPAPVAAPETNTAEGKEETPPTTEGPTPAEPAPVNNKLRFKARIDHEDVEAEIDESDLPSIYQKATATERYQQKLAKVNPVIERLERMAKANGYNSPEEMLDAQESFERDNAIAKLVEEGTPKVIAEDYVSRKYGKAAEETKPAVQERPATAQREEPKARDFAAEIQELWTMRPDLKGTRLPREVAAAAVEGRSLVLAYLEYENKQARAEAENSRKENEILRQNAAAAAKAPVKGVSGGGVTNTQPKDPFLEGFDSDYR